MSFLELLFFNYLFSFGWIPIMILVFDLVFKYFDK